MSLQVGGQKGVFNIIGTLFFWEFASEIYWPLGAVASAAMQKTRACRSILGRNYFEKEPNNCEKKANTFATAIEMKHSNNLRDLFYLFWEF